MKQNNNLLKIVAFMGIAFLIFALVHFYFFEHYNQPKFIIIENICVNETIYTGFKEFNFLVNSSWSPEIADMSIDPCGRFYWEFNHSEHRLLDYYCEYNLLNMDVKQINSTENITLYDGSQIIIPEIHTQTIYNYLIKMQVPNGTIQQKCEKKEVQEISFQKEVPECVMDIQKALDKCGKNTKCIKNYHFGYSCKTYIDNIKNTMISYKIFNISKKDLTLDWLNQNCKCYLECDISGNCFDTTKPQDTTNCWKYICGNYEVKKT